MGVHHSESSHPAPTSRAFRVAADDKQVLPVGVDPGAFAPIGISSGARSVSSPNILLASLLLAAANAHQLCLPEQHVQAHRNTIT